MTKWNGVLEAGKFSIAYTCKTYDIGMYLCNDKVTEYADPGPPNTLIYLDRHNVQCGPEEGLRGWYGDVVNEKFRLHYTCCSAQSNEPTTDPTQQPSVSPTRNPTMDPTFAPTHVPSTRPTARPSAHFTMAPSADGTDKPSPAPSVEPTDAPTAEPSQIPSPEPSQEPSEVFNFYDT